MSTLNPKLNPKATVRHRRLSSELRHLRIDRGLTVADAAAQLGISSSYLSKAETANRKPSGNEVGVMLDLYGCDAGLRAWLLQLTEDISKRGWWTDYPGVVDSSFFELEDDAVELRTYQRAFIPGLLQTDEYSLAVIKLARRGGDPFKRAQIRAERRKRLERPDPPVLHAVIEEEVIHRPVGGKEVHRGQLEKLLEHGAKPHIRIQVMPREEWRHPGHEGPFTIMGFGGSGVSDVIHYEILGDSRYREAKDEVDEGRLNFAQISEVALSDEASKELIEKVLGE